MDTELQMADAREYILRLRGDLPPLPEPPPPEPPAPPAPAPIEDTADLEAGQLLTLAPDDDGLALRSATGTVYGRLIHERAGDRWAHTADGRCLLALEQGHRRWTIVARSADDDAPIAAFHRGWRPGGDVWVAPDDWSTLRWSRGREASWRLESENEEILRVRPIAADRMEIALHAAPARLGLLILLVCQVAFTDTLPLDAQVGSDGADIGWALDTFFG